MLEEKLLVFRYNRGDVRVIHSIYEKYKDSLMTLAAGLLYDSGDAEDIVHDVFKAFIRSCGTVKVKTSLVGYLVTCVANTSRNRNKAAAVRRSENLDGAVQLSAADYGPMDKASIRDELGLIGRALGQLPYEQREVVVLHLQGGMTFKAIGELLDISINTAQGRYRYGLDKLRSLLNSEAEQ